MKKKKLTTKERVDLMLKHGVNHPEKWMPIHGYNAPKGTVRSWKKEYQRLMTHHLDETGVLFDLIGAMINRLNPPPPPPKVGDKVCIPWTSFAPNGQKFMVTLFGTIKEINGAYHYIKVRNYPKLDVVELYPNEFEVVR